MSKVCKLCGEDKPKDAFRINARKSGLRKECKVCEYAKNKEYRQKHKERLRQYDLDRATPERRAATIAWQHNNRDKLREYTRARYAADKGVICARVSARMKRMKQATPRWLPEGACDFAYVVAKSFSKSFEEPYEVDHIVPLIHPKVCGLHVPWNLRVCGQSENRSKGNTFDV